MKCESVNKIEHISIASRNTTILYSIRMWIDVFIKEVKSNTVYERLEDRKY
jgi:hypothetical protein